MGKALPQMSLIPYSVLFVLIKVNVEWQVQIFVYRSLARIGNAYYKKNDLQKTLVYFNKSLSEHRDVEVIKKSQEAS